ncbi:hypothetical protein [Microvirus mar34]|uniref:Uncharacterized protein n=1 Tax=Microvirus mar34 TaxID=2851168 RepID=A0A8F5MIZ3_9VIRU|nr:hypothetical protein [Microvirus mar34]
MTYIFRGLCMKFRRFDKIIISLRSRYGYSGSFIFRVDNDPFRLICSFKTYKEEFNDICDIPIPVYLPRDVFLLFNLVPFVLGYFERHFEEFFEDIPYFPFDFIFDYIKVENHL